VGVNIVSVTVLVGVKGTSEIKYLGLYIGLWLW
jgi:hypothetical protein